MHLLALEGVERIAAQVVLDRAAELRRADEDTRFWNMAKAVQTGVARALGGR